MSHRVQIERTLRADRFGCRADPHSARSDQWSSTACQRQAQATSQDQHQAAHIARVSLDRCPHRPVTSRNRTTPRSLCVYSVRLRTPTHVNRNYHVRVLIFTAAGIYAPRHRKRKLQRRKWQIANWRHASGRWRVTRDLTTPRSQREQSHRSPSCASAVDNRSETDRPIDRPTGSTAVT